MQIESGDYLVVIQDNKKYVGKVIDCKKRILLKLETDKEDDSLECKTDEIVANLGKTPTVGSVYSKYVEPLLKRETWDSTPVYFYTRPTKKEKKYINKKWLKITKNFKLNVDLHLKKNTSSVQGMFKCGKEKDILVLSPISWYEIDHVLYHEIGHHIWFRELSEKQKIRAIEMYESFIKLSKIDDSSLKSRMKDLIKSGLTINQYKKELDGQDLLEYEAIIKEIKLLHNLSVSDLDLCLMNNCIEDYWPKHFSKYSEIVVEFSAYASKNPQEFFCEAFAFFNTTPKVLPKSIRKKFKKLLRL